MTASQIGTAQSKMSTNVSVKEGSFRICIRYEYVSSIAVENVRFPHKDNGILLRSPEILNRLFDAEESKKKKKNNFLYFICFFMKFGGFN